MEEKVSRRQWMGSVAKAGLVATGVAAVAESEIPGYAAAPQMRDKPFDIHQHLASPVDDDFEETESVGSYIERDYSLRARLMDANGIGQAVLMPSTRRFRHTEGIENTKKLNDLVATYVAKHSDRFPVGIGTVEPTHGKASLKELERIAGDLKFRGVVWHHASCSGAAIDDPFMRPILRKMSELRLIPFIHIYVPGPEDVWRLEIIAAEFPNMMFVALDGLASSVNIPLTFALAKRQKNIIFDTGPTIGLLREKGVASFVKEFGADRLIFGSDLYALFESEPSYYHNITLDIINNAKIAPEQRAKILSGNARKLLGL